MFSAANDTILPLMPSLRPTPPPRPQHPSETPRNGKIRAPCMIRGAVRRKGPLPGKICALCIPERRFAALFGYMARISCQTHLVLDAWRRYVAREGRFSRPGPLQGCMKRENCHGWPPRNAPRRKLATARRLGTHRGVTEPGSTARTKRQPIQQRATTRPRNRENLLVPSAEKRRRKHARVLWRS